MSTQAAIKYRKDYRACPFKISQTELHIDLNEEKTRVISHLHIERNALSPESGEVLVLSGENLSLLNVEINGEVVPQSAYEVNESVLSIHQLPEETQFVVSTEVEIEPQLNTSLEGLYRSNNTYCTQCEAEGFRKITYYLDRPDVLSIFTTTITADKTQFPFLLSNGNLVEKKKLENNRHQVRWHDPFPKPSYLFALVAGDFDLLEDTYTTVSGRHVDLQLYVDKGKLDQCHYAMESLKRAMKWDEERFNLEYDLGIYMIVAVGDFNMGAMENKGLNIFNTKYVLANEATATDDDFEGVESVIGHEYFHNWTGNRVTCRDWFQLSLKEGLTVFRDQEFTSDLRTRGVKRIDDVLIIQSAQFAEDAGPMAHPIRPDSYIEMNNFYTVTVYDKGAEVIRMIHTLLGEEGFQAGMKLYFERHDGDAVTCEDFVKAMEDATDTDLSHFRLWYSQAGTPVIHVQEAFDQEKGQYTLTFEQSCSLCPGETEKKPFHIPIKMALLDQQGKDVSHLLAKSDQPKVFNHIFHLKNEHDSLTFEGVTAKPIPSLLRDFSAPVKLNFDYKDEELTFLLAHDGNDYNRWHAGQQLLSREILRIADLLHEGCDKTAEVIQVNPDVLGAMKNLLTNDKVDGALKSRTLTLPTYSALIEMRESTDIDSLICAWERVAESIAHTLENSWQATYDQMKAQLQAEIGGVQAASARKLKNLCLFYLTFIASDKHFQLAISQYDTAINMTDRLAAFKAIINAPAEDTLKQPIIDSFSEQWCEEPLVMDKWFSTQAISPNWGSLQKVEQLIVHPNFDIKNPNKVRSVIGCFAGQNFKQFHESSGGGYRWVADQIIALDALNPQIAARISSVFNRWKKFDKQRQHLMLEQLKRISVVDGLSKDTYEIVSKALDLDR